MFARLMLVTPVLRRDERFGVVATNNGHRPNKKQATKSYKY
jgi:tRNA (Thr-GGU) A37 N-methylase